MIKIENGQTIQLECSVHPMKFRKKVNVTKKGERLWLKFGYNDVLLAEIKKSFTGTKWHGFEDPPIKQWSISDCEHNRFQLAYMAGMSVYENYDKPLLEVNPKRKECKAHQVDLFRQGVTRRYCIFAAEMGTGKTLSAMEVIEYINPKECWWVGPKAALHSVELEFKKWKSPIKPRFLTYNKLKTFLEGYEGLAPQVVILDESSRCKNGTAQRTQAAAHLAYFVRNEWGDNGCVIEMSGSPAPKSPVDWYSQCEIARPGFLREGDIHKFKDTLGIIATRQNHVTGGVFPQLVTWRDDETKCDICGLFENDPSHDITQQVNEGWHQFKPSVNEVSRLYKRMSGLVMVKFKKDCLDLPEKVFRTIELEPSKDTLRLAKLITSKVSSTIKALILLRELSDGFQYEEVPNGTEPCDLCKGSKTNYLPIYIGPEEDNDEVLLTGDSKQDIIKYPDLFEWQTIACCNCDGLGAVTKYQRTTKPVKCPKEDALIDLLELHEDIGRFVIFGGFTGSVDRCVGICQDQKWNVIRVDGRGWLSNLKGGPTDLLELFQNAQESDRIAFIGQPGAAGMGLNLTASPGACFYSNDFNAESRLQAVDRIHRMGMDVNLGATIYDLLHLPTDRWVLDNLNKKRDLQAMSMGQLNKVLHDVSSRVA